MNEKPSENASQTGKLTSYLHVERMPLEQQEATGFGNQKWEDGSEYDGSFLDNTRHGFGCQTWSDGEKYKGQFFKDNFHGFGIYSWPDDSFYAGTFYMDHREGYGVQFTFNNSCYEGLFGNNSETGIGRLVYFDDESMDVGIWQEGKLVKLLHSVSDLSIFKHFKRINYGTRNEIVLSNNDTKLSYDIFNEDLINLYSKGGTLGENCINKKLENEVFVDFLPKTSYSINRKLFNKAFTESVDIEHEYFIADKPKHITEKLKKYLITKNDKIEDSYKNLHSIYNDYIINLVSAFNLTDFSKETTNALQDSEKHSNNRNAVWNRTHSCMNMKLHILRHHIHRHRMTFDVDDLLSKEFSFDYKSGHLEQLSLKFLKSCLSGEKENVKQLLKSGKIHVDVCDEDGNSGLIAAAMKGNIDVLNLLLDLGANINRLNDFDISALMAACLVNYLPVLCQQQSQKDEKNSNSHSKYSKDKIAYCLENSENNLNFNSKLSDNSKNCISDVDQLLLNSHEIGTLKINRQKSKINFERFKEHDDTKQHFVLDEGHDKTLVNNNIKKAHLDLSPTIELLLKRGADPNISTIPFSPLHLAIISSDVRIVNLLIKKGANQNLCITQKDDIQFSPLHYACCLPGQEALEIVRILLMAGAFVNLNQHKPECIRTPIQLVCSRENDHVITSQLLQLLINYKADVNYLFDDGLSPLAYCLRNSKDELASQLLENGADPNLSLGGQYQNALCVVLANNSSISVPRQITLIEKLIQHGADVATPVRVGGGEIYGNIIDYVHHLHKRESLSSTTDLHYHETTKLKKQKQDLLDFLSKEMRKNMKKHNYENQTEEMEKNEKVCFECGRSVSVKLSPCYRCSSVSYCSKTCRSKSWKNGHKYTCTNSAREKSGHTKQDLMSPASEHKIEPLKQSLNSETSSQYHSKSSEELKRIRHRSAVLINDKKSTADNDYVKYHLNNKKYHELKKKNGKEIPKGMFPHDSWDDLNNWSTEDSNDYDEYMMESLSTSKTGSVPMVSKNLSNSHLNRNGNSKKTDKKLYELFGEGWAQTKQKNRKIMSRMELQSNEQDFENMLLMHNSDYKKMLSNAKYDEDFNKKHSRLLKLNFQLLDRERKNREVKKMERLIDWKSGIPSNVFVGNYSYI